MNATKIIVSLSLVTTLSTISFADGLGPANGFTIFTIESYQANNTDCTGRVAVGGPATYNNFGVGSALSNSNGNRDDVIVAGNLTWNNGQNFNGNIQVLGPVTMNNVGVPNGSVGESVAIDFASAEIELQEISDALYATPANGTVSNNWGQLTLTGSDSDINIFHVSQSDLHPLWGMSIDVPEGSSVVVNINHHSMQLSNFQPMLSGCEANDIVFNFPVANSVQLSSIGWKGTILAPKASIQFNNGQIDGALICRSIQGNGESHHAPFDGNLPCDSGGSDGDDGGVNGNNNEINCACCCHINSFSHGVFVYGEGQDDDDEEAEHDTGHPEDLPCECQCDCDIVPYDVVVYD